MTTNTLTEFDLTTSLQPDPTSPGDFDVDFNEGWASLAGIHGGYMAAIATRGAERVVADRDVRTITTSFVRTGAPGPARLAVIERRRGRSISTVDAEITQNGRVLTNSRITMLAFATGTDWTAHQPMHLPPISERVSIEPPNPVPHFQQAEGILHPSSLPFTNGDETMVHGRVATTDGNLVAESFQTRWTKGGSNAN